MPAWKAALYRKKAQANYSYFVAGLSDHVCLKSHFRLVKEDRIEVENADFNVPLEEQKKYTRKKNKKTTKTDKMKNACAEISVFANKICKFPTSLSSLRKLSNKKREKIPSTSLLG